VQDGTKHADSQRAESHLKKEVVSKNYCFVYDNTIIIITFAGVYWCKISQCIPCASSICFSEKNFDVFDNCKQY